MVDYYTRQQGKLEKGFEAMYRCAEKPIARHFDERRLSVIHKRAKKDFTGMIPTLPYIGGKKVPGTRNLIGGAQLLGIIRALEAAGMPKRDIGEVVYQTWENYFGRIPGFAAKLMGRMMFSPSSIKKRQATMAETQKREYPEAFVTVYAPSADGSYDFGQNVMECAVHKFYRAQNALDYLPYICLGDYPMFRRMGIRFYRTQALGHGGDCCDFRFCRKGETLSGWPPESLAEWQG